MISLDRIQKDFDALARLGGCAEGGCTRLAFSDEDMAARDWLVSAMTAAGLSVRIDAVGNICGRREGDTDLPAVMLGSHLDTVPEGGHYDGVVGVLAALEVARALNLQNVSTRRPVEVVNFSAEESSRFGLATIGSKAMIGQLSVAVLKKLCDDRGQTLYRVLLDRGLAPDDLASAALIPGQVHAFLELHIEQGPVLEDAGVPIGVVTAIAAATRFKVVIEGHADHSGNTPMTMRKDALAAASELVLAVEQIAGQEAGPHTVGTVGALTVAPGAMNVIPGRVELWIDLRDIDSASKSVAVQRVMEAMTRIAEKRGVKIGHELICDDQPVVLSAKIRAEITAAVKTSGLASIDLPSGAGHDAMNMAAVTESGMIFIPSIDGISHNVAERTRMEDVFFGTQLLLAATLRLADQ